MATELTLEAALDVFATALRRDLKAQGTRLDPLRALQIRVDMRILDGPDPVLEAGHWNVAIEPLQKPLPRFLGVCTSTTPEMCDHDCSWQRQ